MLMMVLIQTNQLELFLHAYNFWTKIPQTSCSELLELVEYFLPVQVEYGECCSDKLEHL